MQFYSHASDIYLAMRASNKFAKVSTDDITNKLIANQSVHKDDRNIVKNRVKTFFYDLSKRQSHSEKPLAVVRKAETSPLTQTHSHHLSLVNVCHDTRRRRISPIIAYLEAEAENRGQLRNHPVRKRAQ